MPAGEIVCHPARILWPSSVLRSYSRSGLPPPIAVVLRVWQTALIHLDCRQVARRLRADPPEEAGRGIHPGSGRLPTVQPATAVLLAARSIYKSQQSVPRSKSTRV